MHETEPKTRRPQIQPTTKDYNHVIDEENIIVEAKKKPKTTKTTKKQAEKPILDDKKNISVLLQNVGIKSGNVNESMETYRKAQEELKKKQQETPFYLNIWGLIKISIKVMM